MVCLDRSRSLLARRVDEALLRVERQPDRIGEMVQIGQPTKAAEDLLSIFLRLFADLVELEHRINAMRQHTTAASALKDIPQAINSAHIRHERQLLSCPLSQTQSELRRGIQVRKKRAIAHSNLVRMDKSCPRRLKRLRVDIGLQNRRATRKCRPHSQVNTSAWRWMQNETENNGGDVGWGSQLSRRGILGPLRSQTSRL